MKGNLKELAMPWSYKANSVYVSGRMLKSAGSGWKVQMQQVAPNTTEGMLFSLQRASNGGSLTVNKGLVIHTHVTGTAMRSAGLNEL